MSKLIIIQNSEIDNHQGIDSYNQLTKEQFADALKVSSSNPSSIVVSMDGAIDLMEETPLSIYRLSGVRIDVCSINDTDILMNTLITMQKNLIFNEVDVVTIVFDHNTTKYGRELAEAYGLLIKAWSEQTRQILQFDFSLMIHFKRDVNYVNWNKQDQMQFEHILLSKLKAD